MCLLTTTKHTTCRKPSETQHTLYNKQNRTKMKNMHKHIVSVLVTIVPSDRAIRCNAIIQPEASAHQFSVP